MIGNIPMRRFENQIRDHEIIADMLREIPSVHVGMCDDGYAYVVPMVFGFDVTEDKLLVYLHSAKEGHKVDLWEKDPRVSLTFSKLMLHPENEHRPFIHDYRSVMANGLIRRIDRNGQSGLHGRAVQAILRQSHRRPTEFDVPHYMFMNVYVVECDWKNVTAKTEDPIDRREQVRLPEAEAVEFGPVRTLNYDDWGYFFTRKLYCEPEDAGRAALREDYRVNTAAEDVAALVKSYKIPVPLDFHWEVSEAAEGDETPFDVDVIAIAADETGKIQRRYDLAFYNQRVCRGGFMAHMGDDILNSPGFERVMVDVFAIPEACHRIDFILSVYEGDKRNQTLDRISALWINGSEVDSEGLQMLFFGKRAAVMVSLLRQEGGWTLEYGDRAFEQWRASDLFAYYGLAKWKE